MRDGQCPGQSGSPDAYVFFPLLVIGRWISAMREEMNTRLNSLDERIARIESSLAGR